MGLCGSDYLMYEPRAYKTVQDEMPPTECAGSSRLLRHGALKCCSCLSCLWMQRNAMITAAWSYRVGNPNGRKDRRCVGLSLRHCGREDFGFGFDCCEFEDIAVEVLKGAETLKRSEPGVCNLMLCSAGKHKKLIPRHLPPIKRPLNPGILLSQIDSDRQKTSGPSTGLFSNV